MKRVFNFFDKNNIDSIVKEIVFGVEDGIVSTLGAMTGIAVGSQDKYTVLLAGVVIIAVESISMGIGSYVSNRSSKEISEKIIDEEKENLRSFPKQESKELYSMLIRDGWNKKLSYLMTKYASSHKKLMLKEHQYRELGIFPYSNRNPITNALFMFFSYIIGGLTPLVSYFFLPVSKAIYLSVFFSLTGLFVLGVFTTLFTQVKPVKAGLRLLFMGGFAFLIGLIVGETFSLVKI